MPFELFTTDKIVPRGEPMITITSFGRLSLNKSATRRLEKHGVGFVQLLWDKETNMVGVRPAEKVKGANTLSYGSNGNGAGFSSVSFLTYIQYDWTETRNFLTEWVETSGMYVFQIPPQYIGKPVPKSHTKRNGHRSRSSKEQTANEQEVSEETS